MFLDAGFNAVRFFSTKFWYCYYPGFVQLHREGNANKERTECPNRDHSWKKLAPTHPWCGSGGVNFREKMLEIRTNRMHCQGKNN